MDIKQAREIVKAQFEKAGRTFTDDDCFEVYDNRDAAFDSIRGRVVNHKCSGDCGRALNSDNLMVRPLDYSNTKGEYVVVKHDKAGYCFECAPRFMK